MDEILIDTVCKKFFKKPSRFVDLINGAFFEGKHIIDEKHIDLWDNEESNVIETSYGGYKRSLERYRDITMKAMIENQEVLFALENQTRNDHSMVIRIVIYNGLNYLKQWNISEMSVGERRLLPIITYMVHWGQDVMLCQRELKGLLKDIPKTLMKHMNNSKMQSVDIKEVDVNKFKDKEVVSAIQLIQRIYKLKRENMEDIMKDTYINKPVLEFVSVVTRSEDLYNISLRMEEGGWIEMCQAMIDFKNECIEEGEERMRVDDIKRVMVKLNYTIKEAMDFMDVPYYQRDRIEELVMS